MSQGTRYGAFAKAQDHGHRSEVGFDRAVQISTDWVSRRLTTPTSADNKYTRGAVLVATGSPTYPGAAVLGCLGAAKTGSGYVRYLGPTRCEDLVLARLPEAVMGGGRCDAAVIGSGWDASMASIVDTVARDCGQNRTPLVVDAGALTGAREWAEGGAPVVATPHPGEAVSLMRQLIPDRVLSREQVEESPAHVSALLARALGAVVVLKAATTAVADPRGRVYVFTAPAGWGAVAGAGDVLAGVIATCLAARSGDSEQSTETKVQLSEGSASLLRSSALGEAVAVGVGIHGLAAGFASGVLDGELGSSGTQGHPILATDIAEAIPVTIGVLLSRAHGSL